MIFMDQKKPLEWKSWAEESRAADEVGGEPTPLGVGPYLVDDLETPLTWDLRQKFL